MGFLGRAAYRRSLMPTTFPIPVLATFFYVHPEPQPWVARLLARWLWRSWVNGSSSQTPAIRKAVNAINPKKLNLSAGPQEYDAVRSLLDQVSGTPVTVPISIYNFRADSAQGRLILLTLASLDPMRPNGTAIDLAVELENYGPGALSELVPGLRPNAAARAFWPTKEPRFTGNEDPHVLASHAVDSIAASRRRAGDVDGFIQRRTELLAPLVKDFINNRIEVKDLVRPPLDELIVLDDSEE
jgi:hypothetical protein